MQIVFKFKIDQKVVTPFKDDGIVDMAAVDGEGNKYYVKTRTESQWFKEEQLTN